MKQAAMLHEIKEAYKEARAKKIQFDRNTATGAKEISARMQGKMEAFEDVMAMIEQNSTHLIRLPI
jgi:hypothetical protein